MQKLSAKYPKAIILSRNKRKYLKSTNFFKRYNALRPSHSIKITIKQNNIFMCLMEYCKNKTLLIRSAGNYKLAMSRRKLKESLKIMLRLFKRDAKNYLKQKKNYLKSLLVQIAVPSRHRWQVARVSSQFHFRRRKGVAQTMVEINPIKSFNGCRPRKRRRKKVRVIKYIKPLFARRGG